MNINDLQFITPLLIIASSIVLIIVGIAIKRNHLITCLMATIALTGSIFSFASFPRIEIRVEPLFIINQYGILIIKMVLFASLAIVITAYSYLEQQKENKEEYYLLLLSGTLGAVMLILASHFISFFLGFELLSISVYVLSGYIRDNDLGVEAAIKYLILAGAASSFLLLGLAIVYGVSGTMEFASLGEKIFSNEVSNRLIFAGLAIIFVGIGFKLALVPFHLWIPDVYQGSPPTTAAFIASISKGSVVIVLIHFFNACQGLNHTSMIAAFSGIAILSMLIGNILALFQKNLKRILAYSSIAHLGYILVAFIAGGEIGMEAVAFYLLIYFISIIAAFGLISMMLVKGKDMSQLDHFRGIFWRQPICAVVFITILFSLAGIPLTGGFIGKFYILSAAISSNHWILMFFLVIGSAIGFYYYLRIIVVMFSKPNGDTIKINLRSATGFVLLVLTALVIWLGVNPEIMIEAIKQATSASLIVM